MLTASGVEWRAIEDAGHWLFIDKPKMLINEMLPFMTQFKS
jgi:hypothetical protein